MNNRKSNGSFSIVIMNFLRILEILYVLGARGLKTKEKVHVHSFCTFCRIYALVDNIASSRRVMYVLSIPTNFLRIGFAEVESVFPEKGQKLGLHSCVSYYTQ